LPATEPPPINDDSESSDEDEDDDYYDNFSSELTTLPADVDSEDNPNQVPKPAPGILSPNASSSLKVKRAAGDNAAKVSPSTTTSVRYYP